MKPQNPRTIVPSTTFRDAVIGGVCAVLILAFVLYGMMSMASKPPGNRLTGTITERRFTPAPEQQIEFGKKGMRAREIDGEHIFVVQVKAENRTYEVPVDKILYESKKVGDSLTFIRPRSEQK